MFFLMASLFIFLSSFHSYALQSDITQVDKNIPIHAQELSGIFERKVLRVAMYERDTPPFYFVNEKNQLTGVDVEIIKGFARKLGLKVKFIRHARTLDEVVNIVARGEADLAICKLSITFSRATKVLFTKPYIKLRKGLLVNRVLLQKQLNGRHKKEVIQQLKGTLGVIGNSSYVTYAKQRFKHMKIKEYSSWKEVVDAVLSQEIIAGFRDEAEIKKVILDNKDRAINLLTVVLEEDFDPKGIAVQSQANYLKALLDFYIDSIGLKLTANIVLFEYDSVLDHLNRYDITKINN
jgi:ABC-type amino acid transport substrate-binding protein